MNLELAKMKLMLLQRELGGAFTYNEALELFETVLDYFEATDVNDQAYDYLLRQCRQLLDYLYYINQVENLHRHEHFYVCKGIAEYDDKELVEFNVLILLPINGVSSDSLKPAVRSAIIDKYKYATGAFSRLHDVKEIYIEAYGSASPEDLKT